MANQRLAVEGIAIRLELTERVFGILSAPDACRAKEDHRVLDVLGAKPTQRFEILGQNPQRPGFLTFDERRIEIGERLRHEGIIGPFITSVERLIKGRPGKFKYDGKSADSQGVAKPADAT